MPDNDPWMEIVGAKNALSTAGNILDDAIGEMTKQEQPTTEQQAAKRRETVRQQIDRAERELQRARRKLGVDQEDD